MTQMTNSEVAGCFAGDIRVVPRIKRGYATALRVGRDLATLTDRDSPVFRRFAKNFSISLGGSLALLVLGLGRTALLTKTLAIEDYGRVLIVINLFSFLQSFLSVRVHDVILKFFPQFEESQDFGVLRGLLVLCLALSLMIGLLIGGGVFIAASWIANRFYQDSGLVPLFRIYASVSLLTAFEGVYGPILRLHDLFSSVVIPQVLGSITTLALLGVYFYSTPGYHLEPVLGFIALGILVATVPPLIQAMCISSRYLRQGREGEGVLRVLARYRHDLLSTLFQTNLVGYLKLASSSGGLFLLGILSTPTQVALYGFARQLTSPLVILQNNVQTAITPEIVTLWAKGELKQLYHLVRRLAGSALILGGMTLIAAFLLARPVILLIARPQYFEALPVFYLLLASVYLTFISLTFYPVALSLGRLKQRNMMVATRLLFLGAAVVAGLNASSLAAVQFAGSLVVRLFFDIPLSRRLYRLSRESSEGE